MTNQAVATGRSKGEPVTDDSDDPADVTSDDDPTDTIIPSPNPAISISRRVV